MPSPLSPEQMAEASVRLEKLTQSFEDKLLEDISRRIAKAGAITDTAEYQILRLKEMGYANDFIEKAIAEYTKLSAEEVSQLFFDTAQMSDDFYSQYYEKKGVPFVPYESNDFMQQLISAGIEHTNGELQNFTQSMGFMVKNADGTTSFKPCAEAYQSALDLANMQVASGTFDYTTAIRNATASLCDGGLQFVDYATGRRNRCDVAVRRAVLTGIGQMTAKVAEHNMDELGTEYVETTAHAGARPDHAVWQGRVFLWNKGKAQKKPAEPKKPLDNGGAKAVQ